MTRFATILAAAFLFSALAACQGEKEKEETIYRVRGVVRKIKEEGRVAVIDHEEIPGYMKAMVMPFETKDPAVFAVAKAGDKVEFDYRVEPQGAWVENLRVIP